METPKAGRSVSDAQVLRKLWTILEPVCSHVVSRSLPPPTTARVAATRGLWHCAPCALGARRLTAVFTTIGRQTRAGATSVAEARPTMVA
jgi:hypothetical protein